ncbi:MAG: tetratricopeptide repeat protein [Acidobacteria bacterium]|nr:tetratricopeptide repeat protein [Acidobacteriota bacterium]
MHRPRIIIAMLTMPMLAAGCVRYTTAQKTPKSPDQALRAILQQQIQGAFDPLRDDPRVQALQTRLKLDPQDAAARLELAAFYENYRFFEAALQQYGESFRISRSEQAVMGFARSARASGRAPEAIPLLEAFLKEFPAAGAWNQLGLLYDELGDLAAGEAALREAVARDAKSDRLRNNLGYNLLLQNKTEAAEAEFRKALELNSKSATTRNNLGAVLARRGDAQGALEQFREAADAATAHNNLAVVLLEMGQYEESRDQLIKALTIRHNFAPALANFKLVQERIRGQVEAPKSATTPLSAQSKEPEDR